MEDTEERAQLKEDINEIDLLISDLLEAERLNNEHAVLAPEVAKLADFIHSIVSQFEHYEGGLTIEVPNEDQLFEFDKLRVRLLLTNLLNNAIRHGEENPITVKVSFGDELGIIEVIDNGEGISEDHLPQISEPFYRADSARQRNTGGFGLGLYLCRLIAQAHGGQLIIRSNVGEGTHMTVNLPRRPPT